MFWVSELLGQDQLAQGGEAQAVNRLAVFYFDFLQGAEELGTAPAARCQCSRGTLMRGLRGPGRRPVQRCSLLRMGAGASHGSGGGRWHRVVMRLAGDGDHPVRAPRIALVRCLPAGLHLRPMEVEGLAGTVVALAAAGSDGQLELQLVEAGAADLGRVGDVAIRDPVADTNYHASNVMRIVRISKCATQTSMRRVSGAAWDAAWPQGAQEPSCDCR